jgi:hypothetical protein
MACALDQVLSIQAKQEALPVLRKTNGQKLRSITI